MDKLRPELTVAFESFAAEIIFGERFEVGKFNVMTRVIVIIRGGRRRGRC
jgi:hypothetical protein